MKLTAEEIERRFQELGLLDPEVRSQLERLSQTRKAPEKPPTRYETTGASDTLPPRATEDE